MTTPDFTLSDLRYCYHDGIDSASYFLARQGVVITDYDYLAGDSYDGLPLTRATMAGIVALCYGVDLTP